MRNGARANIDADPAVHSRMQTGVGSRFQIFRLVLLALEISTSPNKGH